MRKLLLTAFLPAVMGLNATTTVTWQSLGNEAGADGNRYVQRFTVRNHKGVERLCFNMFKRPMSAVNPQDSIFELIPGYYCITSPRLGTDADSVVIDIETRAVLSGQSYTPDGLHVVTADGRTAPVDFKRMPIDRFRAQWSCGDFDRMPYGDTIYRLNERISGAPAPGPFDVIPSFKHVTVKSGTYTPGGKIVYKQVKHENPEYYSIVLDGKKATIKYASERARKMAERVLTEDLTANNTSLPNAVIEDYPDLHYRGIMMDIARNYTTMPNLIQMAQAAARHRMNKLHFHFNDDEAWRLEIPGLPELTAVGSRKGYTLDEHDFLAQTYRGNGEPDYTGGSANGYLTRDEFISFLRECDRLGIDVIPEIESPGHARAAIKAMEARYRNTGDDTYRLIEDGDTSKYESAQNYHDNVMNPALPGPYRFFEKVVDELVKMYAEAGVKLPGIHIGGDEVPHGSWSGAPSAQAMIKDKNLNGEHGLQGYYVRELAKILGERNLPMYGWQEVAIGYDDDFNNAIAPGTAGVNCWSTLSAVNVPDQAVKAGFPVILSNVNHFYIDQAYEYHPEEPGLTWGAAVDEFASLHGYPEVLSPEGTAHGKVVGMQGQLFSETIREFPQVQYYFFPKMFGLAERAWNSQPTYTDAEFNRLIGDRELPRLASRGDNFRLHHPGIIKDGDKIKMNSPYESAVIRYTLDGTSPDTNSPVYTAPVKYNGEKEVRAALFYLGHKSVDTVLYID